MKEREKKELKMDIEKEKKKAHHKYFQVSR